VKFSDRLIISLLRRKVGEATTSSPWMVRSVVARGEAALLCELSSLVVHRLTKNFGLR